MKLKILLKSIDIPIDVRGSKDIEITGMTSHSQAVAPGYLFVAKRGEKHDGNRYVSDVIRSGAHAILSDIYDPSLKNITQIIVSDIQHSEAVFASQLYGKPSRDLCMIGITGTSGKTTSSYLLRHMLLHAKVPTGLIGTISYISGSTIMPASRTTPEVVLNQKLLKDMVKEGEKACVMEVTSHAIDQGRIVGIDFDIAIFTNLSHEHLDYHLSMESYASTKRKFFQQLGGAKRDTAFAVMNSQDTYFSYMKEGCSVPIFTYGIEDENCDLSAWNIHISSEKTTFDLSYNGEKYAVTSPLRGRFNVLNTLAASLALLKKNIHIHTIIEAISLFESPPGRLEPVPNSLGISIFVDYAHKEDALRKVLPTVRECTKGNIITVFGCGGDRDREKRPKMAQAVEELSDIAIVTSDNPRSEDPKNIIQEIVSGFSTSQYVIEIDRKKAIEKAISLAKEGDAIVIAGKGHEKEQIFHHYTVPFDDYKVAYEFCKELYARKKR